MAHKIRILLIEFATHDIKRFIVEKPKGYKFIPANQPRSQLPSPAGRIKKDRLPLPHCPMI